MRSDTDEQGFGKLGHRLIAVGRRRLPMVHLITDSSLWVATIPFSVWLRYDFGLDHLTRSLGRSILAAVVLQALFGYLFGQYRRRWRYGSFDEVRVIALTAGSVGAVLTVAFWSDLSIPRSVPMLAMAFSLLGQVAIRSAWRSYVESTRRPSGPNVKRLLVVGAGDASSQIVRTLLATVTSPYVPVALLDDDPMKGNLRISGVRVEGSVAQLPQIAAATRADAVLVAVASAESELIRRVDVAARSVGLDVLVLPPVHKLLGPIGVSDIRPVSHADLLGRRPAEIDPVAIAGYLSGKRVLVTGAGGSIGSELCRQIVRFEPAELIMLDRDESGLHATQLSLEGRAMLDNPNVVLADIRDGDRIDELFRERCPDIVFHAAALKHLPLLEMYPHEGWKTNVVGTSNLLDAAQRHGVTRFVNVSTDKAANPTSILGWTKRITERLTAHADAAGEMTAVSVRFGNVLGSNGSVLKTFEAQAANGGPLTVTDPDVTRYFMTIEEAARLTVHAGAIGQPGEVMILDMGSPIKIADVAQRIADQHVPQLEIVFTGLRPNEKLHEDLISDSENGSVRSHPLITHVPVPPLDRELVASCGERVDAETLRAIAVSHPHHETL